MAGAIYSIGVGAGSAGADAVAVGSICVLVGVGRTGPDALLGMEVPELRKSSIASGHADEDMRICP